jgi:hypothetical protein
MSRRALSRGVLVVIAMGALGYILGYAARLPQLHGLSSDQQAWAVFALGLIAAIVFLFRAAQLNEVSP